MTALDDNLIELYATLENTNRQIIRAGWFAIALVTLLTAEYAATGRWPLVALQVPSLFVVIATLHLVYRQRKIERRNAALHRLSMRLDVLAVQLKLEAHRDQHEHEGDEYSLGMGAGKLAAAMYLELVRAEVKQLEVEVKKLDPSSPTEPLAPRSPDR